MYYLKRSIPIFLFLITLTVYWLSHKGEAAHLNYFVPLADAFLHGRLYLTNHPSWLNELVFFKGHYFVVYPPMPAILLVPFVALFGPNFYQPFFSILIGSVNVVLCYLVFLKIYNKKNFAFWISLLFAFGTMQWFHAEVGSAWYLAHIVSLFFVWLMLFEVLTKQRLFLIGLFIGAAYLSRLPTILSVVFVLIYFKDRFFLKRKINFKNLLIFSLGLLPVLILNFAYNYLRFGVIYDISYSLLPVFQEPWYRNGLFSVVNIPIHLKEVFFALPEFISQPPFVIPSFNVLALWFVTPALLLIPLANFKKRIVFSSLIATLIIAIPDLSHGSNGFSQFGFRFAIDFLPFLLIMTADGLSKYFKWGKLLIILSMLINLWGVIMISHLGIWTM